MNSFSDSSYLDFQMSCIRSELKLNSMLVHWRWGHEFRIWDQSCL